MARPARPLITGIHHPNVGTTDYSEAFEFFTKAFGMRMVAWYLMHGSKDSDHALMAYSDERNSGFFSLCNRPAMNKLSPVPGVTSPAGPADTVAPGAMQSISFHVASEEDLVEARAYLEDSGYAVGPIVDRGYDLFFSLAGPHSMRFLIAVDKGTEPGNRDLIDVNAAAAIGLSEADLAAAISPPAEPEASVETPNPDFFESRYRFVLTKDTAFVPHVPVHFLNWLMSEPIPPSRGRSLKAKWSKMRKVMAVLPRFLLLKLQGKLKVA